MAMGRLKGTYICFVNGGSHFLVNVLELLYILIMIIIDHGITYYDTSLLNFCLNTSGRTVVEKKVPRAKEADLDERSSSMLRRREKLEQSEQ